MLQRLSEEQKRRLLLYGGVALAVLIVVVVLIAVLSGGGDYQAHYDKAEQYFLRSDYDRALEEIDRALEEKQTAEAYLLWASVCYAQGETSEAIQVLYLGYARVGGDEIASMLERLQSGGSPDLKPPVDEGETVTLAGQSFRRDAGSAVLSGKGLTDEGLKPIAALTELESLSLTDNAITDLSPLVGLSKLSSLQLSGNRISDLSPLSGLTKLKTLYLDGNPLADLTPLYSLKALRTLSMKNVALSAEALQALRTALPDCRIFTDVDEEPTEITLGGRTIRTDVTELDLSGMELSDISELAKCTLLRSLDLHDNRIADVSALAELTELEELYLAENAVRDLAPLTQLKLLRVLDLGQNRITDLAPLGVLTELEELVLNDNEPGDFAPLRRLTGLKRLGLKNTGLTDADLELLHGLTELNELDLEGNPELSAEGVEAMAAVLSDASIGHDELRWSVKFGEETFWSDAVNLVASGLGVTSLDGLEHFTELVLLDLDDNHVSDLSPLYGLSKLKTLYLRNNDVTPEDVALLQAHLPGCTVFCDEPEPTEEPEPTTEPAPSEELDVAGIARGVTAALDAAGTGSGYAVVWDGDSPASRAVRLGFVTQAQTLGMNLVADLELNGESAVTLQELSDRGADVVILALTAEQAQSLVAAAAGMGYAPAFILVD